MSIKAKSGLKVTQARHFQLQRRELETVLFIVPFSQTRQLQKKEKQQQKANQKVYFVSLDANVIFVFQPHFSFKLLNNIL